MRIGTAEIYRQVEQLPEVVESLVIGQDWPPGEVGDVRVVLFVQLRDGLTLDDGADRPHQAARSARTRRRATCPPRSCRSTDIPRTKSGKIVELAVRNVVHGREVKNLEALANPEALEQFRDRAELQERERAPRDEPHSRSSRARARAMARVPTGAPRVERAFVRYARRLERKLNGGTRRRRASSRASRSLPPPVAARGARVLAARDACIRCSGLVVERASCSTC